MEAFIFLLCMIGETLNALKIKLWDDFEVKNDVLGRYYGHDRAVVIPEHICCIGTGAFRRCENLESVLIPERVTSIGDSAFALCKNLTDVNIPERVTVIENHTFYQCTSLKNITIPKNILSIGNSAFAFCENLTDISLPDDIVIISENAFDKCRNLKNIRFRNIILNPNDGIAVGEKINLIRGKNYSAAMKPEVKYDILFQMYMLDMEAQGIHRLIQENCTEMINYLIEKNHAEVLHKILVSGDIVTNDNIDDFILYAIENQKYDVQLLLTDYKYQHFGFGDIGEKLKL